MLTREKLEIKLNKPGKICMTTVCLLPSGAIETLTNYQELESKKDYLLQAYDNDLRLKTMPSIILLDCIVICEEDINKVK